MKSAIATEWVSIVVSWAIELKDVDEVYFFGSRLKGTAKSNSDLDIGVIVASVSKVESNLMRWFFLHEDWQERLQNKIDVLVDLQLANPELSDTIVYPAICDHGYCVFRRGHKTLGFVG